jgi:heme exporter protein CcmD
VNILRFLGMGGYAVYVWPCYALTALVVGLNIVWARRSLRSAQREARRRMSTLKAACAP